MRAAIITTLLTCLASPASACWDENSNPLRLGDVLFAEAMIEGTVLDSRTVYYENRPDLVKLTEFTLLVDQALRGPIEDGIITVGLSGLLGVQERSKKPGKSYRIALITPEQVNLYCPPDKERCGLEAIGNNYARAREIPFIVAKNCSTAYMVPLEKIMPDSVAGKLSPLPRLWLGFEQESLTLEMVQQKAKNLTVENLSDETYRSALKDAILKTSNDWEDRRQADKPKNFKRLTTEEQNQLVDGVMTSLEVYAQKFAFDPSYRQRFIEHSKSR